MEWMKWLFPLFSQRFTKRINQTDCPGISQKKIETTKIHRAIANHSLSELCFLLDMGVDIEAQDENGLSPLHLAIKRNFVSGINLLLELGASPNVRDDEGSTPLHFAVLARNFDVAQKLIDKGAEKKETDKYGITCLHMAAYNNDWDIFNILLNSRKRGVSQDELEPLKIILSREYKTGEENDINTLIHMTNEREETPLHIAAKKSKINLVEILLDFDAETDIRDNLGLTALHVAIENEADQIVKLLIDGGADVNIISDNQEPLLFSAIRKRNLTIMEELLNNGANKEIRHTIDNITPLIFAARENYEPEVELLLDSGADVDVRDNDDYSPLDYVIRNKNFNLFQKLVNKGVDLETVHHPDNTAVCDMFSFDLEQTVALIIKNKFDINMGGDYGRTPLHYVSNNGVLVELLLNNGADIDAEDIFGSTPLFIAMKRYSMEQMDASGIEMLMSRGASVNVRGEEGKTLLHYALTNSYFVDILLDKGADIEAKDDYGKTPVFNAIHLDDAETGLEIILNRGANVNAQDNDGKTPLHYSACLGNHTLVNILLSYGADLELKDNEGQTPFFEAVLMHPQEFEDNNNSVISILIEKGANVNAINKIGRTVLFYKMNVNLMNKICNSGVDVTIKDDSGQTALHSVMSVYDDYNDYEMNMAIECLIKKGANLLSEDNEGITPLQIYLGRKNLVPGHMSDINPLLIAADIEGNTLLHVAVQNCSLNLVKHIIDIGVRIDSKNKRGATPLHLAVSDEEGVNIVKELLKRGASVNMQNDDKDTPLHRALNFNNELVIEDLLIRGARMDTEDCMERTPLQLYSPEEPQDNKILKHIVKLKAANLFDDVTCDLDLVDCSGFESFNKLCLTELKMLEGYKFDCLSLIDVFRKFEDPLFVSSSKLKEIITSPLLEIQFPIYNAYLKVKFEQAELRNSLLNSATNVIANVIPENRLPNEIIRKILSNLSKEDLLIVIDQ